jgi:hypothetical protein
VLVHIERQHVARLIGWLSRGVEPSRWTPGRRFRHLVWLARKGP